MSRLLTLCLALASALVHELEQTLNDLAPSGSTGVLTAMLDATRLD